MKVPEIDYFLYFSVEYTYLARSNMTALAVLASNPVVGSSKNSTEGLMISSIPMLVLFLSPPDTPRMKSVPIYNQIVHRCKHARINIIFLTEIDIKRRASSSNSSSVVTRNFTGVSHSFTHRLPRIRL